MLLLGRASVLILTVAGFLGTDRSANAEDIQHLTITQPGGMPGLPVMTGVQRVSNGVSVTWFGPAGYYQLFEKTNMTDAAWRAVGGLRLTNQAILNSSHAGSFFSVSGPTASYAGSRACLECHYSGLPAY